LLFASVALADKRVALVIGNGAYLNAPPLTNPARDAKAIGAMLQNAGFNSVEVRSDLGNLDFKRALRDFFDVAKDADIALVFFAGHGIQIADQNYMIPIDARLAREYDAKDEAISLERIVEAIEPAVRLRLVILDACRDNPFLVRMQRRVATRQIAAGGLARVEPTFTDTLIAYAAKAGSTAEDGEGDHSPFTTALLKHVAEPGLDIRLAFGRVRDEVRKATRNEQEPFVYGSLGGANISLVPPPAVPVASNLSAVRGDYEMVERINTRRAWEVFIATHQTGMYVDLARERVRLLEAAPSSPAGDRKDPRVAALPPPAPPPGPTREQDAAWDRVKESQDPAVVRRFLESNKSSPHAVAAQSLLERLEKAAREKAEQAAAEAARKQAEAKRIADEKAAAESKRLAEEKAAAEAKRLADEARKQAEAKRLAEEKAAAEAKRLADEARRQAEAKRLAEERAAAEAERMRKAEEARKVAEAQRLTEEKAAADAKRLIEEARKKAEAKRLSQEQAEAEAKRLIEETRKQAEAKRLAEEKAAAEAKRLAEEARKQAETKKLAEEKAVAEAKRLAAEAAAAEAKRIADEKAAAEAKRVAEAKAAADAERARQAEEKRLATEKAAAEAKRIAAEKAAAEAKTRVAQLELRRIGCFSGRDDGLLSQATKDALELYHSKVGKRSVKLDITDDLIEELKRQQRVCPLVCRDDQVAQGDQCIAKAAPEKSKATEKRAKDEPKQATKQRRDRDDDPPRRQREAGPVLKSGGGGGSTMTGVGF
jgi:hypothetical protein